MIYSCSTPAPMRCGGSGSRGQVMAERHGEYFLMDGANGLRFKPKTALRLPVGAQLEVVGFPDMSGPSPVLREAVARKPARPNQPACGHANYPKAAMLNGKLGRDFGQSSNRVSSASSSGSVRPGALELQTGNRGYVARVEKEAGQLPDILPGSRRS